MTNNDSPTIQDALNEDADSKARTTLQSFMDWERQQRKEIRGGRMMYDIKGQHKWINEADIYTFWKSMHSPIIQGKEEAEHITDWKESEIGKTYEEMKIKWDRLEELEKQVGELPEGAHPDERKPRAETWLKERANWESEVETLRAKINEQELIIYGLEEGSAEWQQKYNDIISTPHPKEEGDPMPDEADFQTMGRKGDEYLEMTDYPSYNLALSEWKKRHPKEEGEEESDQTYLWIEVSDTIHHFDRLAVFAMPFNELIKTFTIKKKAYRSQPSESKDSPNLPNNERLGSLEDAAKEYAKAHAFNFDGNYLTKDFEGKQSAFIAGAKWQASLSDGMKEENP